MTIALMMLGLDRVSLEVLRPTNRASALRVPLSEKVGQISQQRQAVWADKEKSLPNWSSLEVGQRLELLSGRVERGFDVGAEIILQGPVDCQVVGPSQIKVHKGIIIVLVSKNVWGFSVCTARGKIIDLGIEFGVDIESQGSTDVAVFDGLVDVEYEGHIKRVKMGEAVRLSPSGTVTRIDQVEYDRFSRSSSFFQKHISDSRVIGKVSDNLRGEGVGSYYQICQGGFDEDSRAYFDRDYEWNGIDQQGMPFYLRGADYVMMFNSDKGEEDFEVQLHLIQPADVFVFWDDRFTPPNWLAGRFSATGDYIGMDECPLCADEQDSISNIGVGAGESVEFKFSIWKTRVMDISKPLTLGTIDQQGGPFGPVENTIIPFVSMYGIAAVPVVDSLTINHATSQL